VPADLRPDPSPVEDRIRLGQEFGQGNLEDGGQSAQRGDRGPGSAAFELGQEAFAQPGLGGGLGEGSSSFGALGPELGAEVGVGRRLFCDVEPF